MGWIMKGGVPGGQAGVGPPGPAGTGTGPGGGATVYRCRGRCKWFNVLKGWGFITPTDKNVQEVFCHQTAIFKTGFRSLSEGEEVEFEFKETPKGLEATVVSGPSGLECRGSDRKPLSRKKFRKIRCYNCGEFSNHVAAKCPMGPMPKRCHHCKSTSHLVADCPHRPADVPDPSSYRHSPDDHHHGDQHHDDDDDDLSRHFQSHVTL